MAAKVVDHIVPRFLYDDVGSAEKYRYWTYAKRHPDAAVKIPAPEKAQKEPTWGYAFGLKY